MRPQWPTSTALLFGVVIGLTHPPLQHLDFDIDTRIPRAMTNVRALVPVDAAQGTSKTAPGSTSYDEGLVYVLLVANLLSYFQLIRLIFGDMMVA